MDNTDNLLKQLRTKAARDSLSTTQVSESVGVGMATANKLLFAEGYKPREITAEKLRAFMEKQATGAKPRAKGSKKVRTRKTKVEMVGVRGTPAVREPQLRDRMEQVAHHLMEEKGLMPEYRRRLEALGMGYSR